MCGRPNNVEDLIVIALFNRDYFVERMFLKVYNEWTSSWMIFQKNNNELIPLSCPPQPIEAFG